ncbi:MAG TPA: adenylate/guanylate cyclase domain-containing protein, partial [Candidatus Ozemobacteraceae bacterium]|nr:adenylate/guanylate cyclase domain-containing protein [Candidatus Ozemobacteraceae bacterium]
MAYRRSIIAGASEDRLNKLIEERLKAAPDTAEIDNRIWDLFGEEWTVMFTDLSGFSRNVAAFGIIHFLQTIYESERILVPIIEQHDGILLKVEGDSMLVIFRNPCKAIHAALSMQSETQRYNRDRRGEDHVLVCIGLGHGRVLRIGDSDVFGQEVNAASKLGEDTAKAGQIMVTDAVRERAKDMSGVKFAPID